MENNVILGDSLQVLRDRVANGTVDLIYLDPPFFIDRAFKLNAKDESIGFQGGWEGVAETLLAKAISSGSGNSNLSRYVSFLHERIIELHRVLADDGSLFLHIGPTEAPYIRLVLDAVFGMQNHRSTITWQRSHPHNNVTTSLGNVSDLIFYYTKSRSFHFNLLYTEHDEKYLQNSFNNSDDRGQYALAPIVQEKSRKGHVYEYNGVTPPYGWRVKIEKLKSLDDEGLIHWGSNRPYKKIYLESAKGAPLQTVWSDIHNITRTEIDRRHYPTQKPIKLLQRIVGLASTEDDLVLDPFCGSGTTLVAAQSLGRRYIGIDVNPEAIAITTERLKLGDANKGFFSS